jgi:hypothetical protein
LLGDMETKRIGSAVQIGRAHLGRWAGGAISEPSFAVTPVKEVVPNPPVIQSVSLVENALGTIKLMIELPTTNSDGSPLAIGELVRLRVKYGPASDDLRYQNDFSPGSEISFAPGMSGVVYLAAQVQDSHGNWSALSSVVQSPSIPSIQESLSFWAHRLNADAIFTNNSPSAGYVSWSNVKLSFRDETWEIQNGNTNKRYIWWDYSQSKTTFQTSDNPPSLDLEDVLIAVNINGTCYLYMYRPMIAADFLRAGTLQSANWSTSAGSQFSLNDGVFKLGGSASPKLSWDGSTLQVDGVVKANQGSWLGSQNSVQISSSGIDVGTSGYIRGGATGYNAGTGFWLGYDSTAYKFFIGNSTTDKITWDGSSLTVYGTIQAKSGGWIGASNAVQISSQGLDVGSAGRIRGGATGYDQGTGFWLGYDGTTYKFFIGKSDGNKLTWDGSALTIYGTIQAVGGYLGSSSALSIQSGGLDVGSAGYIRGGATSYNQGTGFWMGYDTSASKYRFFLGAASGNKLLWDGSTLTIVGTIQAGSGSSVGAGSSLGGSNVVSIESGGISVGTSGYIRSGTTGYNQGTGFWLGYDQTAYKFFVGNSSGSKLLWDGASLTVVGTIQAGSGSSVGAGSSLGGSNVISIESGGISVGASGYIRSGTTGYNQGTGFWMGYDASASKYRFFVGDASGGKLLWDGSSLVVQASGGWLGSSDAIQIASGGISVGSTGYIRSGTTGYNSGTGFWMGYDASASQYRLFIGNSAGNKLLWDGSSLTVYGTIQAGGGFLGSSSGVTIESNGISVGSSGYIRGGATGYNQGTGFWLGYDSTTYKFFIGNASGNRLTWDGSSLTVYGTIQAASGFLGSSSGVTIESSGINVGSSGYVRGGKSGYGSGSGFWLGYSGGYKFDIGDSSRYMRWDGSNLYLSGQVYSQPGSYLVTGSTQRTDINSSYSHCIALYASNGTIGAYIGAGQITVCDEGYTSVQLQPTTPQIYIYPHGGGTATIQSYNSLTILSGGSNLTLSGQYGTVSITAYCGEVLRGDSSFVNMPYHYIYWKYGGPTYGGSFIAPAGGIYVYIGSNRYAIPYYGPV